MSFLQATFFFQDEICLEWQQVASGDGQTCTWFRNRREVTLSLLSFCFCSLPLEPGSCPSALTVPGMDQTHWL